MKTLELLVRCAGALHFVVLIASALTPRALDWRQNLAVLHPFLRKLFWVYGAFIVLTIVSFGTLSLVFAARLASGDELGRALAAVIALFWLARLGVQLFVFDARPFLTTWFYKAGYHALTFVFVVLALVFGGAALGVRG
jgi:hypothetical protein